METTIRVSARLFDRFKGAVEGPSGRAQISSAVVAAFVLAIVVIDLNGRGLLPPVLADRIPVGHLHGIQTAFTLLLGFEVVALVLSLADSVSWSVGKQMELFSLILLRSSFKEIAELSEPIRWEEVERSILPILSDAAGALLMFMSLAVYYRMQRHLPITNRDGERDSFVAIKKSIALLLLVTFGLIAVHDTVCYIAMDRPLSVFETFYTVLVFSDVLLVLLSLRHSSNYRVVFRNSGYAVATVILRLALSAPSYINAMLGVGAAVFVTALTAAYNLFGTPENVLREGEAH